MFINPKNMNQYLNFSINAGEKSFNKNLNFSIFLNFLHFVTIIRQKSTFL